MLDPEPMSVEEHLLLQEVIEDRFGLSYAARERTRLESHLRSRLRELHLRRYFDYYLHLKADEVAELPQLAALITNNETYFFREIYQFEGLFQEGIDLLQEDAVAGVSLRLLSAGCSSGEEPYSLGLYARESGRPLRFEIEGFDLDPKRIEQARRAHYADSALRCTDDDQKRRYFRHLDDEVERPWELRAEYRSGVRFRVGNLLEEASYGAAGSWDVILCRNVLIYFSDTAFRRAVELFAQALRPGGLLFLGHSESLIGRSTDFETVRLDRCIAYRRRGAG